MFTSEFLEKTALEIPLPGKRADEVETLLRLIYFKEKEHVTHEPSGAFSSPWHFSDVVLIVEGRRFYAHKCILSISSPVFEAMFTSDFKEKLTALEIPLPGKRAGEVEVLLNLICFKNKQSVTQPAAKIPKTDEESSESDSHESHEPSGAFSSPWHLSDAVLIVEERRFHVHKSTLSMWSPVFEAMFTSDFKEKTALEIPLPGKRADEVEVLLNLICFKNKQSVTHENFEFLLKLADEYQMEEVKNLCTEFISSILRKTNCLHLFQVVDRFGLNDMKLECVKEAKSLPMSTIENDTHYADISPEVK
ncbi:hypothetical protein QZH41_011863, partial [Actinostola sp. cb2023]